MAGNNTTACVTRLDATSIRLSLGLRLGLPIVSKYICLSRSNVCPLGYHCLLCKLDSGRQARHLAMNNYLFRLFQKANIPAIKGPAGFIPDNNFRPDGSSVSETSSDLERYVSSHIDKKYINYTSIESGSAVLKEADFKNKKYKNLTNYTKIFINVCIEASGPVDKNTIY
ncbi:hypothetical protein HELRODRAFT_172603 [Helobdella robusta]|uniref:Uncharacterized protein n=1 Tax=Helobdella robusta TaxID=6412 RepID=T1F5L6_HELRO|nr:hypothetical protein HELRODRAFT_172603 [Helobdella robusta]ESO04247.1 hypothetical protein HELRODRAFT_172603 [Helobdella robusta]